MTKPTKMEKMSEHQEDMFGEPARSRRTDPETSKEAAAHVNSDNVKLTKKRAAVLKIFQVAAKYPDSDTGKGMTDEDMIETYNDLRNMGIGLEDQLPRQSVSGLRTRRSELVAQGLLKWSGDYGLTKSGRKARKWTLVSTPS